MRMSVDKAAARASVEKPGSAEEDRRRREEIAEEAARIVESVKGEAAQEDETTPDGLAYHVNTFELEVERFLEVESWNDQHGFEVTDDVEEGAVEEMKARQAAGDERRSKIKEGFEEEDKKLTEMDKDIKALAQRLEKVAEEAEKASQEELGGSALAPNMEAPGTDLLKAGDKQQHRNPYSEYKAQLKDMESGEKLKGVAVDDAGVRSRVSALRAESELLRGCMKAGDKGNFEAFRHALAKRDGNT